MLGYKILTVVFDPHYVLRPLFGVYCDLTFSLYLGLVIQSGYLVWVYTLIPSAGSDSSRDINRRDQVLCFILVVLFCLTLYRSVGGTLFHLFDSQKSMRVMELKKYIFDSNQSAFYAFLLPQFIGSVLLSPLLEELIFSRLGVITGDHRRPLLEAFYVVCLCLVFAVSHFNLVNTDMTYKLMPSNLIFRGYMYVIYGRSSRLWIVVLLHSVNNLIYFV